MPSVLPRLLAVAAPEAAWLAVVKLPACPKTCTAAMPLVKGGLNRRMRLLPESATYRRPLPSTATLRGSLMVVAEGFTLPAFDALLVELGWPRIKSAGTPFVSPAALGQLITRLLPLSAT